MGKIILLIIGIFMVLFVVRLLNAKAGGVKPRPAEPPPPADEKMVRCARCGVYLPRSEAQLLGDKPYCRDPGCKGSAP